MAPLLLSSSLAFLIVTSSPSSLAKKTILLDETWTSTLAPMESRNYMLERSNWLNIVPDCDKGSIQSESQHSEGAWSILSNEGTHILCTNTVSGDERRSLDDDDDDMKNGDTTTTTTTSSDGCYLSYNVKVTTPDNKVQFTVDIEYDITDTTVRRQVHSFQMLGGFTSKMLSPMVKPSLIELMQEENRRLLRVMNHPSSKGALIDSSVRVPARSKRKS